MGRIDHRINIGEEYGIYTIVEVLKERDSFGNILYKGVCKECGYERIATYYKFDMARKNNTSCRHVRIDGEFCVNRKLFDNKKIGKIFYDMKCRCYNQNNKSYQWYGGKGIKICDEWMDNPNLFEDWAISNGYKDGLTIDRIDEDKNYCPENCRWITYSDNSKYKSTTSLIDVDGEIHSGRDWTKILGVSDGLINRYVRTYGIDNTVEFIKRYRSNPNKVSLRKSNQSYYDLYMT